MKYITLKHFETQKSHFKHTRLIWAAQSIILEFIIEQATFLFLQNRYFPSVLLHYFESVSFSLSVNVLDKV